jgi:hypothetical protein
VVAVPRRIILLALPGLALAVAGLFHPHHLTYETSWRWFALHLPGLVVFPLVGLALAELVHGRRDAVAWLVRLTAYIYATFYSALDVISGIAAGYITHELGPGTPRPDEVRLLFRIGTPLGQIGSIALIGCCALLTLDLLVRKRAWPVLLLVPGAVLVHVGHIFAPEGVLGMALLGVGTAATAGWTSEPP